MTNVGGWGIDSVVLESALEDTCLARLFTETADGDGTFVASETDAFFFLVILT